MWELEKTPIELVVRASAIFAFLFILLRFWGKKHFGQLSPFDFILLLIMSEAVQNALVDGDKSVTAGMISILTMVGLNVVLNRIPRADALAREKITEKELMEALRLEGVSHVSQVATATLEANGTISVIKKDDESLLQRFFH